MMIIICNGNDRELKLEEEFAMDQPLVYERLTERNEQKFVQKLTQYRKVNNMKASPHCNAYYPYRSICY
jgi:hypothetical protein